MKIVYKQGKHTRTVYVATHYVAKTIVLLKAMCYEVISVKAVKTIKSTKSKIPENTCINNFYLKPRSL